MVAGLLDTSIRVDLLRAYQPAEMWLATQNQLGVTHIIWLELLEGAQNKRAQTEAIKLLQRFELVELYPDDLAWSVQQLAMYGLSHNIGAFDCLIAAANHRLNVPLYTHNLKHFSPILGQLAISPYT